MIITRSIYIYNIYYICIYYLLYIYNLCIHYYNGLYVLNIIIIAYIINSCQLIGTPDHKMVVPLCTNQLVFPSTSEGSTVGKAMRNVRAHVQDPGQWHGVGD